jgi:hypothetical protein
MAKKSVSSWRRLFAGEDFSPFNRFRQEFMLKQNKPLESIESASPRVTRAVAAGLMEQSLSGYQFNRFERLGLGFLGVLPSAWTVQAISRSASLGATNPGELADLRIGRLIQERLNDYAQVSGRFPSITIGAALGGAAAAISLSVNGPFLPQAFVLTVKGGSETGETAPYFMRSSELASQIAAENPGVLAIQHFDPVHDGWLTRYVNHLRLKLLILPDAYKRFIRNHLDPNGTICFLDCHAKWLRYRVAPNRVFQVGGWGGIPAPEYLHGSQRLDRFQQIEKLKRGTWQLEGFPLEEAPESEWGCEPEYAASVNEFCQEEGYRFLPISYSEPHLYSHLAYQSIRTVLMKDGREPAGVLVEMFSQFDTPAIFRTGLLPVWLVFNTNESLQFLKSMRRLFPPHKPVFFSPLSTFTRTPDLVPWEEWEEALTGFDWINIGTRRSHYPADPKALISWSSQLSGWVREHEHPIRSRLTPEEIHALAGSIRDRPVL